MIWDDGRSGTAGCVAGNIALQALDAAEQPIKKLKGTTFESAKAIIIGRVCASDAYLDDPIVHWANASWDQHAELDRAAKESAKSLVYLFITASSDPPTVRFWRVPAKIIDAVFAARDKKHRGRTCAIHIVTEKGKPFIGDTDVSKFSGAVQLGVADVSRLRSAFKSNKREGIRQMSASTKAMRPMDITSFDIPAAGAQTIRVQMRLPLAPSDVNRLKQWVDLMADVLTEENEVGGSNEFVGLQQKVQIGVDALDRGDSIDGEQAFQKILGGRKKSREVRR